MERSEIGRTGAAGDVTGAEPPSTSAALLAASEDNYAQVHRSKTCRSMYGGILPRRRQAQEYEFIIIIPIFVCLRILRR